MEDEFAGLDIEDTSSAELPSYATMDRAYENKATPPPDIEVEEEIEGKGEKEKRETMPDLRGVKFPEKKPRMAVSKDDGALAVGTLRVGAKIDQRSRSRSARR